MNHTCRLVSFRYGTTYTRFLIQSHIKQPVVSWYPWNGGHEKLMQILQNQTLSILRVSVFSLEMKIRPANEIELYEES